MKMHPVGKPSANFQNKQLRYWSANRNRFSLYLGRTMTAYCKLYQDYFKFKKSDCQDPGCKNNCILGGFFYTPNRRQETGKPVVLAQDRHKKRVLKSWLATQNK